MKALLQVLSTSKSKKIKVLAQKFAEGKKSNF